MISIPVLMYHNINLKNKIINHYMTVSIDKFIIDMKYIKKSFNTIFVQDLIDYVYNKNQLPENPILITFDDGYDNLYHYAYDMLVKLKMKATVSLITSSVGRDQGLPKLNWCQIKEMYDSGYIDFQSHSNRMHRLKDRKGCLRKDDETIADYIMNFREDYLKSKLDIEKHLNNKVIAYFYPYGFYSQLSEHILKQNGCLSSFLASPKIEKNIPHIIRPLQPNDLYCINRIAITNLVHLRRMSFYPY